MPPRLQSSESQLPTPPLRSGRISKITEKAKEHFATQAKKREVRAEKAASMQVAAEIESQAGPDRDDNILLGELEPFQAPNTTGDPVGDRKLFVKHRTAWLVRALLLVSGRDVRNDLAAGEIGLKDLEAYWADHNDPTPCDSTQSHNATTTASTSGKSQITLSPTIETLKTSMTSSAKKASGLSLSQASAHLASSIKVAGNKRGPTDLSNSPHAPTSAPNKIRRTEGASQTPPRPRTSFAHPSTPEQIPAPRRPATASWSSSQPVRPYATTPARSQPQHGASSAAHVKSTTGRSSHSKRDENVNNERVNRADQDRHKQKAWGDDESVDGDDEQDEQPDAPENEQDDEQDDPTNDRRHNNDRAGNGQRDDGVQDRGGHGNGGPDANEDHGNRRRNESDTEHEDRDEGPAVEPPPPRDVQDPNKPRLRSFRPIEHRRLVKVVADKVLARLIAEGTYKDVLRARRNGHGDRITSLEQYAAEEWEAECRRRNLRRYRLQTIHIKYIRGRVTSWRARVKERVLLELRSTHKLGIKKNQTRKRAKTLLPHAFHSSAKSNKHALFTGDILPELVRIAIYVHARDIGPLYDNLFNPAPIGLIAFVCTIANHVIRLFESGRYRARSLRVPEQASTFRMYHSRLLQMQENQPTRLANVRCKIYNACVSSLSIPIAAPDSPPLSDREWTPDSEHEFVARADESGDDSGGEDRVDEDEDVM